MVDKFGLWASRYWFAFLQPTGLRIPPMPTTHLVMADPFTDGKNGVTLFDSMASPLAWNKSGNSRL